ncbi:hypothetical protein ElyMa_000485000 [Elysia marginata]|uniref:Uncharacterized protein n=1 Tax=Elysia marginata TaxID=1093978 RepID=A0AAV4FUW6_9GAST|nr:hypothetical protein ElyMa_000485000 [Elysia marginata]
MKELAEEISSSTVTKVVQSSPSAELFSQSFQIIPKPEENGWQRNSAHELEVQSYKDDFIPDELTKIVADDIGSKPEDEDEGDEENYESDFLVDTLEDEEDVVTDDEHI